MRIYLKTIFRVDRVDSGSCKTSAGQQYGFSNITIVLVDV